MIKFIFPSSSLAPAILRTDPNGHCAFEVRTDRPPATGRWNDRWSATVAVVSMCDRITRCDQSLLTVDLA